MQAAALFTQIYTRKCLSLAPVFVCARGEVGRGRSLFGYFFPSRAREGLELRVSSEEASEYVLVSDDIIVEFRR